MRREKKEAEKRERKNKDYLLFFPRIASVQVSVSTKCVKIATIPNFQMQIEFGSEFSIYLLFSRDVYRISIRFCSVDMCTLIFKKAYRSFVDPRVAPFFPGKNFPHRLL